MHAASREDESPTASATNATVDDADASRAHRREIEKRSRRRRQQRLLSMHVQVETLCRMVQCVRLEMASSVDRASPPHALNDGLTSVSGPVDLAAPSADEQRLRRFVRRSLMLAKDAKRLRVERNALEARLRSHRIVESAVRTAVAGRAARCATGTGAAGDALGHIPFEPWPREAVSSVITTSLDTIHRFSMSTDHHTSGYHFMGWNDSRRLDRQSGCLQFSFSKTFSQIDAGTLFEQFWDMQFSAEKLRRYNYGWSTKIHVQVMQRVSRDIAIVRRDVQYVGIPTPFHTVLLMFRRKTLTGFMACLRTVPIPSIQRWVALHDAATHIDEERDASGRATGCRLSFCGTIASESVVYVDRLMLELAMLLVRGESTMIAPRQLDPSS